MKLHKETCGNFIEKCNIICSDGIKLFSVSSKQQKNNFYLNYFHKMYILNNYQENILKYLIENDCENTNKCISMLFYFIENYPTAKGSSHNHQNFDGGYYKHISDIMYYANILYKNLQITDFLLSDAILILFLHDIEKPIKYCSITSENNDTIRKNLIEQFKIVLNEEHILALKYIHGEGDDYSKTKRIMSPLCAFCHCCDVISARIFFN